MDAPRNGRSPSVVPGFPNPFELKLGHGQHHVHREAPEWGGGIERGLGHHKSTTGSLDSLHGGGSVGDRASEAVQFCDDDALGLTRLYPSEGCLEARTIGLPSRLIEVFVPADYLVAAGLC